MINENYLTPYYQKIASALNDIVPKNWDEIVMYGEELSDVSSVGFYFKLVGEDKFRYGGMIPDEFGIDLNEYFKKADILSELIESFWEIFINSGMPKWYTITFRLSKDYSFKVKFGYEINRELSSTEREIHWAYNELGIIPEDNFSKKILEEYLSGN